MSALAQAAQEYLRLRRSLGHDLTEHHRLLPRFVAYLNSIGAATVTIEAALAWAQQPDTDPANSVWPRRMTIARGFARHMASIDPATEIPPLGLIPSRQRWRPPYIYSPADIDALMATARAIQYRLPAATHETLIGLLAVTGLRVGEAIRDRGRRPNPASHPWPSPHVRGADLRGWYQAGLDVEAQLPMLSTYLGHRDPRSTYWYLSAAPELLALAAGRLELSRGVIAR